MGIVTLLEQARMAGLTLLEAKGRLVIRGPRRAQQLAEALLARKSEVLEAIAGDIKPSLSSWTVPQASGSPNEGRSDRCPRCGHEEFVDVPIHNGASCRRDCAHCGKFWRFPVWYGRPNPN